jgi:hypothetical protein
VFQDNVVFASDTLEALGRSVAELRTQAWGMLLLGQMTCSRAVAYHESVYERILADVPDTPTAVALWLRTEYGIDRYYRNRLTGLALVTSTSPEPSPLKTKAAMLSSRRFL